MHVWQTLSRLTLVMLLASPVKATLPQVVPLAPLPSLIALLMQASQAPTAAVLLLAQLAHSRLPLVLLPAPAARATLVQEVPQPHLLLPPVWLMPVTPEVEAVWCSVWLALSRRLLHRRLRARCVE
jgi:hypothetical protein